MDANGILSVSAQDKTSGRQQQMQVTPASGLSADEIERLIAEASSAVETDRRIKEVIALRTRLESLVRNTQRAFREFGGALPTDERQMGQLTLIEGEEAAKSEDSEQIRRAHESVEHLASQLTMAMLNPANATTGSGASDNAVSETEEPNSRL